MSEQYYEQNDLVLNEGKIQGWKKGCKYAEPSRDKTEFQ